MSKGLCSCALPVFIDAKKIPIKTGKKILILNGILVSLNDEVKNCALKIIKIGN
jgi:hypothetical protein